MKKGESLIVGVLLGGPGAEHDVSLLSGRNIVAALRKKGYRAHPLLLTKKYQLWRAKKPLAFPEALKEYSVIFIALHGTYGEDGQIQAILEHLSVPYTGSGAQASRLGIDKWACQKMFQTLKLAPPRARLFKNARQRPPFPFPLVVKPRASGSSDGVSLVRSDDAFIKAVRKLAKRGDDIIVQEYIAGREFSCGVLEHHGIPKALPVIEIRPKKDRFFTYRAKYTKNASQEIVPAPLPRDLTRQIQTAALLAHRNVGCRAYSRSDFLVRDGQAHILEINTLPGMTKTSLMPQEAEAAGIAFEDLVEKILLASLRNLRKME